MYSTQKNVTKKKPELSIEAAVGKFLTNPDSTLQGGLRTKNTFKESLPEKPLISIITVCLNSEKTIEQCIQSVLQQSYENIEYIIIDGHSSDKTLSIIESYKDAIDYFSSSPDSGLYHAMNKGLELALGDYIIILNSDDWYPVDCIKKLVKAKKFSCTSFVSALAQYVDHTGSNTQILRHMPYDASLQLRMPLRHETMLLSAALYNTIGLYDVSYKIIADLDLTIRLFKAGYTLYELQEPLLFFRNNGISNTNKSALFLERTRLIKKTFPFLSNIDAELFSNLTKLHPKDLTNLALKHSSHPQFIESLQFYFHDRYKVDNLWRSTQITWPKIPSSTPLISIILPIFNAEKTLNRCIDSILSQSLNDFELICINDADSDSSLRIIRHYQKIDSRIIYLKNKHNIGLGATRNKGIRESKGQYIFHIDPDDTIPVDALQILYSYALKYDSDMVKGAYLREQIIHGVSPQKAEYKTLCTTATPIINTSLKKMPQLLNTTEGHWSYLYKRHIAIQTPYPIDLKMGQDSIFIVHTLINAKKITIIDDIVYHYCINQKSSMNSFTYQKYLDALEWRRRAWHLLNDVELNKIGDSLLQNYWGDQFFKNIAATATEKQLFYFFEQFRTVFKEVKINHTNSKTSSLLSLVFDLIIKNKDIEARTKLLQ